MDHTAEDITSAIMVGITFISLFAGIFLAWFFYLKAKQKERLALIEKASEGIDAAKLFEQPKRKGFNFRFPWLKLGILVFSITFGLMIGTILWKTNLIDNSVMPLFGFMFGGIGMIAAHFTDKRKNIE